MDFLKKVLPVYVDDDRMKEKGFFTNFFHVRPEYYTNAEYVEVDVKRGSRKIAPTLRDWRTGAPVVIPNSWKENKFKPPYSAMKDPVDLSELMQRQFGETDDGEPLSDYLGRQVMTRSGNEIGFWFGRLSNIITTTLKDYHEMFMRTMELQCSQAMQSGTITLKDDEGNTSYNIDFGMKATHKPGVSVNWGASGATPCEDVEALCNVVANDGQCQPEILILGNTAWKHLLADSTFQSRVKKDSLGLGSVVPSLRKNGGIYHGTCDFGNHTLEIWTYGGTYQNLASNTDVPYLGEHSAIVTARPESLDFRLVFGGIPRVHAMDEPFREVVPPTVVYPGSIKVYNRVWEDKEKDTYTAESKMRGLAVPVSIDKFGCINTHSN